MVKMCLCVRRNQRKPSMKDTTKSQAKKQESASSMPESKHLSGDGLRLKMHVNMESLWIDGDGCYVKLDVNCGLLRVTGDGCKIRIEKNIGLVEYVGDGGCICLGAESDAERVKYKGNGGVIKVNEQPSKQTGAETADDKKKKNSNSNVTTVRRTYLQDGKIIITDITTTKADDASRNKSLRIQTDVKAGARININLNGVNGKRVSLHSTK